MLEVPAVTLRSRLHRARKRLRAELQRGEIVTCPTAGHLATASLEPTETR